MRQKVSQTRGGYTSNLGKVTRQKDRQNACRHWLLVCPHILACFIVMFRKLWFVWTLRETYAEQRNMKLLQPMASHLYTMNPEHSWTLQCIHVYKQIDYIYIIYIYLFFWKKYIFPRFGPFLFCLRPNTFRANRVMDVSQGILESFLGHWEIFFNVFVKFLWICVFWWGFSQWNAGIPWFWRQKQAWQCQTTAT